jgi:hypothetical protein
MDNITIKVTFTEEEMYAITTGLRMFMYENKYINESGFNAANNALIKILEHV